MIVFTYSGQGSQQPGMGAAWREHPSWELVEEASEEAGRDLAYLLLEADADELRQTRNAQLATFLTSMVILDAVERLGVDAAGHAGHSLGEYSALTAAGALDFGGAVGLVVERGEAMQAAAGERTGTMAAVLGLDDEGVETACDGTDGDAWVANYNAPGQVVIAGDPDAVAAAGEAAKEAGAKRVTPLEVSGAFHTPFMAPAGDRLREALDGADIRRPEGTVVANVDALEHEDPEAWRSLLNAQLVRPVRWHQSLQRLSDLGFTTFVELGPGSVLTGLVKRTLRDAERLTVNVPDDLDRLLEALATAPEAAPPEPHEGEHLFATERLVVSPAAGVFTPVDGLDVGTAVAAGDLLGTIGNEEVRSPFAGSLMGWLALDTERVTSSQPIAWLQVH
ncbi:MAG: [acyl-carrier-protein] S-malonyltransferase [Acidimicrobiaceae bacterium]|nr:[acyl-carrier-protein] S-malonyltransferase [Acidimicrobiaceae bacterium]